MSSTGASVRESAKQTSATSATPLGVGFCWYWHRSRWRRSQSQLQVRIPFSCIFHSVLCAIYTDVLLCSHLCRDLIYGSWGGRAKSQSATFGKGTAARESHARFQGSSLYRIPPTEQSWLNEKHKGKKRRSRLNGDGEGEGEGEDGDREDDGGSGYSGEESEGGSGVDEDDDAQQQQQGGNDTTVAPSGGSTGGGVSGTLTDTVTTTTTPAPITTTTTTLLQAQSGGSPQDSKAGQGNELPKLELTLADLSDYVTRVMRLFALGPSGAWFTTYEITKALLDSSRGVPKHVCSSSLDPALYLYPDMLVELMQVSVCLYVVGLI